MARFHFISGLPRSGSNLLAGTPQLCLDAYPNYKAGASKPLESNKLSALKAVLQWCFCVLLAIASGSVFASLSELKQRLPLRFTNLNSDVVLQHTDTGYVLTQAQRSLPVALASRLVVKTRFDVSASELKALGLSVSRVQQLAKLQQTSLWLLTFEQVNDLQKAITALQQDPRVFYAQPDLLQTRQFAQQQPGNRELAKVSNHAGVQKRPVRLAVVDDGFNFKHPEFASLNLIFEYDADLKVKNASPKSDLDQHGTLVVGVIAAAADHKGIDGLAPTVELIAIRQVSSWTSDMVVAFSVARMMHADVVNSSWTLPFLPEPLFDLLTDWVQDTQPYLLFAAGNNQQDACNINALSHLPQVWLIGAATRDGKRLPYSNYGSCVAFYAPAKFSSTAANGQGYSEFGGTSAATAYASGLVARELAQGRKPDKATMQQLFSRSTPTHGSL
ncbi:S8/S53 family peptidase [Rheinheimera sp.]|uniref:S8/S53 family peptidase n=1 Tax=Rheinheimera sp. TaxID=1869214 RepID=UPI00307F54A9